MDNPPKEKHDHGTIHFPKDFLWGAATSAHQVEGNNIYSDWWAWEQENLPEDRRSGEACDHYNRYEEDFELAKQYNHNCHRLSIEWARIQPEEGIWMISEIDHYKRVLRALKKRGIKVMLTLWHFTLPKWVADEGGWENPKTVDLFIKFLEKVVPEISEDVDFWITLNEPTVYQYMIFYEKGWPAKNRSKLAEFKTFFNLVSAHKKAYRLIHKHSKAPVGAAQNIQSFHSDHKHSLRETLAVLVSDIMANHIFGFFTRGYHDFLGINYYFHHRYRVGDKLIPRLVDVEDEHKDVSDLGWEVYPEGIFNVLSDMQDHLPIYITECGIASTNDDRRNRFLLMYLQQVYQAIESGVDIRGFFYWSLLDNFEWHRGFDPRFGLVEVDYKSQKRIPRNSAKLYSEIIKNNGIPHYLMRFLGHSVNAKEVLKNSDKH